ncbi:hypothetical protein FHS15_000557 [Paenibacillus castaneae]|uniref:amidase domain-containing protein n=1 Tax=Paenibacillus castaneae TaxID=474957 RepID=UPI000C99EE18|nr:amidase domain-containing protein [Paenibacillus castaneae]NIK75457.1 hypothetical protein [Paenibacillus castaneae]
MRKLKNNCFVFTIVLFVTFVCNGHVSDAKSNQEKEVKAFIDEIFAVRSSLLINKNTNIEDYYVRGYRLSEHALRLEQKRSEYLQAWGEKRAIHFVDASSQIRIIRLQIEGDTAKVSLAHSQKLSYMYANKILPLQSFGIGTKHALTLKKLNDEWYVYKEWYLDPLDENPSLIPETADGVVDFPIKSDDVRDGEKYKRKQAVAYANKYAGVEWMKFKGLYNKRYVNYSGKGGDCTNFASQVIGDQKEGGGLKMFGAWRYIYPSGGTKTWVQTDAFKNFIVHSGYGKVIATGYFTELIERTEKHPQSAFAELMPGDLIAHVMQNDVDHFSVVTGFDDNGYPLVNSHTAERYRAPFDLGWDRNTKYILIHIRD